MTFRILSIDGGGIRGILPGMILTALENKLIARTGDPDTRLADYFDLFSGTSTGGILTLGYLCPGSNNRPRYAARDVVDIYLDEGDEIFSVPLFKKISSANGILDEKYPADELEEALANKFGDVRLSELLKPCLISSYDVRRRTPTFFKQHKAVNDPKRDFYIRDVARATSAAPTYFELAHVTSRGKTRHPLVDGGVIANDPSLCAYAEARTLAGVGAADMFLVSIGCAPSDKYKRYTYNEAKDWGLAEWVKPVVDITFEGGPQIAAYVMEQLFDTVQDGTPGDQKYFRLQPELFGASAEMDDASEKNLRRLESAGEKNAEAFDDELNRIVERLTA